MKHHAHIILLNALTNAFRLLVTVLVAFCLTPVIIAQTGADSFGLWTLIIAILSFFGLLEMGMGTAIMKFVAECQGQNGDADDIARRNRIISTFAAVYVLLLILVAAAVTVFASYGIALLNIPDQQQQTATNLLWILALRYLFLALPFNMFRSVLFAAQMIYTVNIIQIITTAGYGLLAWFALHEGLDIIGLAWFSLGAGIIEYTAYLVFALRKIPGIKISPALIDARFLRQAISFSGSALILQIAALVLLRTDPIIVQVFLSLSAVAAYAVVLKVSENIHLLLKQLVNVIAPLVSQLWGRQDLARIRHILIYCTKYSFAAALALCIPLIVFASQLLELWVGDEFSSVAPVLMVLLIAVVLSIPQLTATTILTMTAHHRKSAAIAVGSVILNLVLSMLLVQPFGLLGVALGTLCAVFVFDIFVVLRQACKIYGIGVSYFLRQAILPVLFPALLQLSITTGIKIYYPPSTLAMLFLSAIPGGILFLLSFWWHSLQAHERQLLCASFAPRFLTLRTAG